MADFQAQREPLEKAIERALNKLAEIETAINDPQPGSKEELHHAIIGLQFNLQKMTTLRDLANRGETKTEVPVRLLRDLDEGWHPDAFTKNALQDAAKLNAQARDLSGRVRALQEALLRGAAKAMPEEVEEYLALDSERTDLRRAAQGAAEAQGQ
ncbi:unnamed protein product [Pedinophyceae sp. YPF-701]|nr:unnamed protein product [Pedinophyceae sp. YPF-701]